MTGTGWQKSPYRRVAHYIYMIAVPGPGHTECGCVWWPDDAVVAQPAPEGTPHCKRCERKLRQMEEKP